MPKLKYPVQEEDRHLRQKIVFSMMEVDPPSFEGLDRLADTEVIQAITTRIERGKDRLTGVTPPVKSLGQAAADDLDAFDDFPSFDTRTNLSSIASQNAGVSALKLRATGDMIDLYLPPAHVVQDILNYNMATPLNISGAAFLSGANAGTGALQSFAQGIQRRLDSYLLQ